MFDDIYILIPVFNESEKIGNVVSELKKYFKNIIVVNDGSSDNSLEILKKYEVKILSHSHNLGQGAAISTGLRYIKSKKNAFAAVTFDADGQHQTEDAINFAKEIISSKVDIIFGSRFLKHEKNIPFLKRKVLKIVNFFTRKFSKINLTDSHNGLKAIKVSIIDKLNFKSNRFAFESEIIHLISKQKIPYKELPTNTLYTSYSKKKGQKLSNGLLILEDLFKSGR